MICSTAKKIHGLIPSHALGIVTLDNVRPLTSSAQDLRAAVLDKKEYHDGLYAWELSNPRIIKPVFVKGKLSLWNYNDDVELADLPPLETDPDGWNKALTELWRDIIF